MEAPRSGKALVMVYCQMAPQAVPLRLLCLPLRFFTEQYELSMGGKKKFWEEKKGESEPLQALSILDKESSLCKCCKVPLAPQGISFQV